MECVDCGSAATSERRGRTAQGYRRFRCRDCGREFNERSGGLLNRTQYPSDVIALVVLWRLRYRLTLQDLSEMFLQRGIVFSHEAVREWEAKLTPVLTAELRQRRRGRGGAGRRSWHIDETYLKVRGRWCYLYRAIDRNGDLVDTMLTGIPPINGLLTALDGSLDPARRDFQRENDLLALHGAPNASMDAMPMAIALL